jgi:hypothetical protein
MTKKRKPRAAVLTPILPASNSDIVWGAREIGRVIGRSERQTFHLLESGALPARKVRERWCASRAKLIAHLAGE